MDAPQEENRIRVEAPPPGMSKEFLEKPGSVSWLYSFLMLLALGCSAASIFLAVFSHWDFIREVLG